MITDSIFDKNLYINCSKIICRQEASVEKSEAISRVVSLDLFFPIDSTLPFSQAG